MLHIAVILTVNSVVVNYNGETHCVLKDKPEYDEVIKAWKEGRNDDIPGIIEAAAEALRNFGKAGTFDVKDGQLIVEGRVVPSVLAKKILEFKENGLPYEPLVEFAKNLLKNPSYRAVQQLFSFLEKNAHPITEDGCFIAYKSVNADFMDSFSRTYDNSPGKVCKMPRNEVNEDPEVTCSNGLHVANWDYAKNVYGGAVMIEVKVNPRDVVAVPIDYNEAKMRTCEYTVLNEVKNARKGAYAPNDGSDVSSGGGASVSAGGESLDAGDFRVRDRAALSSSDDQEEESEDDLDEDEDESDDDDGDDDDDLDAAAATDDVSAPAAPAYDPYSTSGRGPRYP